MPYKPTKVRTSRSNQPEMHLISTVAALGFRATKRGWPDFLCFHEETGEIITPAEEKPKTKPAPAKGEQIPGFDS